MKGLRIVSSSYGPKKCVGIPVHSISYAQRVLISSPTSMLPQCPHYKICHRSMMRQFKSSSSPGAWCKAENTPSLPKCVPNSLGATPNTSFADCLASLNPLHGRPAARTRDPAGAYRPIPRLALFAVFFKLII
eukprot:1147351-Pelagomonas_calceolata.AAC.5